MQQNINISGESSGLAAYGVILLIGIILFTVIGLLLLPAIALAGLTRRQAEKVLNRRVSTVVAQYEPPRHLSPAEIGLLYDMQCGQNEIMATLFHLEQRKIITIHDHDTVQIINKPAYDNVDEYEKIAVRISNGENDAPLSQRAVPVTYVDPATGLEKTLMIAMPPKKSRMAFTAAVQKSVENKGIKMNNYQASFAVRALIITILLSLLPMLSMATPVTVNGVEHGAWSWPSFWSAVTLTILFGFFLLPVYVAAACTMLFVWTKIAGRYWLNTKEARAVWPELEGYKLYLRQVDLDNIQFESQTPGHDPVTETMPYALVFGLDTKWKSLLANRQAKGQA